mmetsp:Transcript_38594/g.90670  ORF Transcript_38594/g.90670 Transcript_38594/m.90670 type:complete len:229 (+) Transcript_38594:218-904(+)
MQNQLRLLMSLAESPQLRSAAEVVGNRAVVLYFFSGQAPARCNQVLRGDRRFRQLEDGGNGFSSVRMHLVGPQALEDPLAALKSEFSDGFPREQAVVHCTLWKQTHGRYRGFLWLKGHVLLTAGAPDLQPQGCRWTAWAPSAHQKVCRDASALLPLEVHTAGGKPRCKHKSVTSEASPRTTTWLSTGLPGSEGQEAGKLSQGPVGLCLRVQKQRRSQQTFQCSPTLLG